MIQAFNFAKLTAMCATQEWGWGGGTRVNFSGYVLLTTQNPFCFLVYSVANFTDPISYTFSQTVTNFQSRTFSFFNPYLPEFSYPPKIPMLNTWRWFWFLSFEWNSVKIQRKATEQQIHSILLMTKFTYLRGFYAWIWNSGEWFSKKEKKSILDTIF